MKAPADVLTGADVGFHNLSTNFFLMRLRENGVSMCQRVSIPSVRRMGHKSSSTSSLDALGG